MNPFQCTASVNGIEQTTQLDAADMDSAVVACRAWAATLGGVMVSVIAVDEVREAALAKLVTLGLTEDEAKAIAGG